MKKNVLLILTAFSIGSVFSQKNDINIIPKPSHLEIQKGVFQLNSKTTIVVTTDEKELRAVADFFVELIKPSTGFNIETNNSKNINTANAIILNINPSLTDLGDEGYKLTVSKSNVLIEAEVSKGLFYGVQSLRQLLPPTIERNTICKTTKWTIPCVTITDKPQFAWRGFMLDVSRTFYGVDVVKKYLDLMSLYKLNVFHLHLTDDQGWRIEIKKYPELTQPKATIFDPQFNEPAERSGFYTQEQLKDLVKYAQERNITIVPEIDLPGHSWPVLITYNELASNSKLYPPYIFSFQASYGIWGSQFTPNILDPTNEKVYEFINNVLDELVTIFPSKYIHFGGDEVNHSIWEKEPKIKSFMQEKGMKSGKELQSYFISRMLDMIKSKGRQAIGWNDILEGDHKKLEGTTIMAWLGENAILESAKNGFYVISAPTGAMYFDITQADRNDGTMTDLAYGHINSLKAVYTHNPSEGLTVEQSKYVLGTHACMWPALAREVKDVNVQLFPRMLALAENGWTLQSIKNFDNFSQRIEKHYPRLDLLKIDYYKKGGYICGAWTAKDLTSNFTTKEWDITKKVYANGRAMAGFYFTKGANYMNIERVDLLENGSVISSDVHVGLADKFRGTNKTKTFQYNLKVENYKAGAKYSIRAKIKGDKGTDSQGNFTFNLCPYTPFVVVEPK